MVNNAYWNTSTYPTTDYYHYTPETYSTTDMYSTPDIQPPDLENILPTPQGGLLGLLAKMISWAGEDFPNHLLIIAFALFAVLFFGRFVFDAVYASLLRWWYKECPPAAEIVRCKNKIKSTLGLTIRWISRDGRMHIEPGEVSDWYDKHLPDELSSIIRKKVTIDISGAMVEFSSPRHVPAVATGTAKFDGSVLTIGMDVATGNDLLINVRNNSLIIVGGLPGTGKTTALNQIHAAITRDGHICNFWTGKGNDFDIDDALRSMHAFMEGEMSNPYNAWDTYSQKRFLIIDEVQSLFMAITAEEKQQAEIRKTLIRDLVQRGRSCGIVLVLATQRPTADAIPTAIRDLAGVRLAGRIVNRAGVEAILGRTPEPGEPDPRDCALGEMVVDDSRGLLRKMKVYNT